MSDAPKGPAQLMNDLTDQVRLLRQDVVSLTATATTKKEAAALRTSVQASAQQAHDRGAEALEMARRIIGQAHQTSLQAARDGAAKAVGELQDHMRIAINDMRAQAVNSRRTALFHSSGAVAVFGGLVALGGVLGALGYFWLHGRADAHAFGENPGIFCEAAGGKVQTNSDGSSYCGVWIKHPSEVRK